jgi:hypothetical protein
MMMAVLIASLLTTAERSDYRSTSRYDDVMAFVREVQQADPGVRVETFATTSEGRHLPLVIAGPRGVTTPQSARASRLPIVFIMANIHAGEVEGKEAAQMLLRDLVTTHRRLRDRMILIVAPIYNADGNERISTENRKSQAGPANGVGQRENAQGLDLNRDMTKLESPEARGLVANVLQRWDPLLFVDLHTTNGSYHGYQLTYSPPLSPNTPREITALEREVLLPEIRERMRTKHGKETYYYGNFDDQLAPQKGWRTFSAQPRYATNYPGLRNRFAILSEAYSYIDFRARVEVTYEFVHEILAAVERHGARMMEIAARADRARVDAQGLRFEIKPWDEKAEVLWERTLPSEAGIADPWSGRGSMRRTGQMVAVRTIDYGAFAATESATVPFAYAIPNAPRAVVENLLQHGLPVETLDSATTLTTSRFTIARVDRAERAFQKHQTLTLTGSWSAGAQTLPAGTIVVRTKQPSARLAFYLLEPRSDDGLFTWNFFDAMLDAGIAPVQRIEKPVRLRTTRLR